MLLLQGPHFENHIYSFRPGLEMVPGGSRLPFTNLATPEERDSSSPHSSSSIQEPAFPWTGLQSLRSGRSISSLKSPGRARRGGRSQSTQTMWAEKMEKRWALEGKHRCREGHCCTCCLFHIKIHHASHFAADSSEAEYGAKECNMQAERVGVIKSRMERWHTAFLENDFLKKKERKKKKEFLSWRSG